MSFLELYPLEL